MAIKAVKPSGGKLEDWNAIVAHYDRHDYNGKSMVFGDSRAASPTAADWATIGLNPARMAVYGLTAEETLWTIRHTDPANAADLKQVFISAGGNDLKDPLADPQHVAAAVQACIRAIHDLAPQARVYFIEIFEAGEAGMSARATEFNRAMDAAQRQVGFHYVELPPLDPHDGRIYEDDGVHLTSRGARTVMMPAIQEARDLGDRYVDHFGFGGRQPGIGGASEDLLTGHGLAFGPLQGGDWFDHSHVAAPADALALTQGLSASPGSDALDVADPHLDAWALDLWDPTQAFLA